jgi:hypothetical protein
MTTEATTTEYPTRYGAADGVLTHYRGELDTTRGGFEVSVYYRKVTNPFWSAKLWAGVCVEVIAHARGGFVAAGQCCRADVLRLQMSQTARITTAGSDGLTEALDAARAMISDLEAFMQADDASAARTRAAELRQVLADTPTVEQAQAHDRGSVANRRYSLTRQIEALDAVGV